MKQYKIKFGRICNFYIAFSSTRIAENLRIREITPDQTSFDETRLKENIDRVNMWIGNCDQKASFVLGTIGVGLTILFTSNIVKYIRHTITLPLKQYWCSDVGSFDLYRFLIGFSLLYIACLIAASVFKLLLTLKSKTNLDVFTQPGLQNPSMLHFGSIDRMSYENFASGRVSLLNDLRSQFYVNSRICNAKFENYKCAVNCLLCCIPGVIALMLLILFE